MTKHYERIYPDTPKNYVLDGDGFAFYCPACLKYTIDYFGDGLAAPFECSCGGQLSALNADATNSPYPWHWVSDQWVSRFVKELRLKKQIGHNTACNVL